ncbi:glycosyltransferase [Amycolatopsis sp. NPDC005003]
MNVKILLSTVPAHGHLLPLLPLARALAACGHTVGVLTGQDLAGVIAEEGFEAVPAGPGMGAVFAESARRHGDDGASAPTPAMVATLFADVRVALAGPDSLRAAERWQPDVVVHEATDLIGPLVATALGVPFVTHALGPGHPRELLELFAAAAAPRFAELGVDVSGAAAAAGRRYLDICPPALQHPDWSPPALRVPLRPEPHAAAAAAGRPVFDGPAAGRGRILVTFGTHFTAPENVSPVVRALSGRGFEVAVTVGLGRQAADYGLPADRDVRLVPFAPMARLLDNVTVMVTHGGAGSVLSGLSRGLPLVVVPQAADQFIQAERVVAAGAGTAVLPGQDIGDALEQALTPGVRDRARQIAAEIADLPGAPDVAKEFEALVGPAAGVFASEGIAP